VSEAVILRTAKDFTDEEVLDLLISGVSPTQIPGRLGVDASVTAQLVRRALDSIDMVTLFDNMKLSFARMRDLSDTLAKGLEDGTLDDKSSRLYFDSIRANVTMFNDMVSTHSDLLSKVTDAQVRELTQMVESTVFVVADDILVPNKAIEFKEKFIERLGKVA